jgi:hypothetical protein
MPNIQPEVGGGMNASWDSSTNSFVISNDSPTQQWIWLRVYGAAQSNGVRQNYHYFQEVEWDGKGFNDKEGGMKLTEDNQEKGPKAYPMPFIYDRKDNSSNNIYVQFGMIVPCQYMGTDSTDGRDVYYFWSGTSPNNRYFLTIDQTNSGGPVMFNNRYSATAVNYDAYSTTVFNSSNGVGNIWAVEQNGSPLIPGRLYNGFAVGYWNPGDPRNPGASNFNDERPLVVCIKQGGSGPNAIRVITGVTNNGGTLNFQYSVFCPDEYTAIINTNGNAQRLIDLVDTPKNYGTTNQLLATNGSGGFYYINSASVGIQWPSPPATGSAVIVINSDGTISKGGTITANKTVNVTGSYGSGLTIQLDGDQIDPGPNMYYGTDSNGVRGWHPLP